MTLATLLADERQSQPVTDWAARIGWIVGLLLFIALVYWLMREGWKWRGQLQSGIPDLPRIPDEPGPARLTLTGRYHGTTAAGQWLDRIVAHGLGVRSRVELTLTEQGLAVVRPGATDFFVPAAHLRGARLDKAIAGKVLTEGGLLVITWEHGGAEYDSGFRSHSAVEHGAWVAALERLNQDAAPTSEPRKAHVDLHSTAGTERLRSPGGPSRFSADSPRDEPEPRSYTSSTGRDRQPGGQGRS